MIRSSGEEGRWSLRISAGKPLSARTEEHGGKTTEHRTQNDCDDIAGNGTRREALRRTAGNGGWKDCDAIAINRTRRKNSAGKPLSARTEELGGKTTEHRTQNDCDDIAGNWTKKRGPAENRRERWVETHRKIERRIYV